MDTFEEFNKDMHCKTCIFACKKTTTEFVNGNTEKVEIAIECRRKSPTKDFKWPMVFESDWCGEYFEPEKNMDSL